MCNTFTEDTLFSRQTNSRLERAWGVALPTTEDDRLATIPPPRRNAMHAAHHTPQHSTSAAHSAAHDLASKYEDYIQRWTRNVQAKCMFIIHAPGHACCIADANLDQSSQCAIKNASRIKTARFTKRKLPRVYPTILQANQRQHQHKHDHRS